jgi:hypothetical protein
MRFLSPVEMTESATGHFARGSTITINDRGMLLAIFYMVPYTSTKAGSIHIIKEEDHGWTNFL